MVLLSLSWHLAEQMVGSQGSIYTEGINDEITMSGVGEKGRVLEQGCWSGQASQRRAFERL